MMNELVSGFSIDGGIDLRRILEVQIMGEFDLEGLIKWDQDCIWGWDLNHSHADLVR